MVKKAGLQPFSSNFYDATSAPGTGNPFDPISGKSQLGANAADPFIQLQQEADSLESALLSTNQPPKTGPLVLFSPSQNKMFVNGALYDADDAQSALDAEGQGFLDKPRATTVPDAPDWQSVSPDSYKNYMRNIEDPGKGTLMARNFEIGGSNLKLLAGRAAQFLGAEELGQNWVDSAAQELYYNQPFQREFTSIDYFENEGGHGAIDWFVANLAQQGPNLIESILVALAGAGAGAVAGGGANPFTATGGAILSVFGRSKVKKELLKAATKYSNGQKLTKGERKLLREGAGLYGAASLRPKPGSLATASQLRKLEADELLGGARGALKQGRRQAMAGGAAITSTAGSYLMGIGDIYGEVRDTGVGNRATAALGAIPYAALETLPEFFLAGRIFGVGPELLTKGNRVVRAGKGLAVGGPLEGLTEVGQEGILLAGTGQLGDAEVGKRLINAFAAGFAIGGPLGGGANLLKRGEATDILNKTEPKADQKLLPSPGIEGDVLGPEPPPSPDQLPPGGAPIIPPPVPPISQVSGPPNFVAGQQTREGDPLDTVVQANQPVLPAQTEGQQGIIFPPQQPVTARDLNQLSEIPQQPAPVVTPEPTPTELEQAGQQVLPLEQQTIPFDTPTQSAQETQQTPAGQQLLLASNTIQQQQNQIEQQQNQLAILRQINQQEAELAQRQREFNEAQQQAQQQQIQRMEQQRLEQARQTEERYLRGFPDIIDQEDINTVDRAMEGLISEDELTAIQRELFRLRRDTIPIPERPARQPRQLRIPGIPRPAPVTTAQQTLRKGEAVAEPTQAELEDAGQERLPIPVPNRAIAIAPLLAKMQQQGFDQNTINDYIIDFQNALDNNDLTEQNNLIADMEQVTSEVPERLRRRVAAPTTQEEIERSQDAVQIRSPEEVDVRQQTVDGQAILRGDAQQLTTAQKNMLQEQIRKATTREIAFATKDEKRAAREADQDARQKRAQESIAFVSNVFVPVKGRTPREMWNALTVGGALSYDRLPEDVTHPRTKQVFKLKTLWSNLVAEDTVNGDLAALTNIQGKEVLEQFEARDNRGVDGISQQEEIDSIIADFDVVDLTPEAFKDYGPAQMLGHNLMGIAFFNPQGGVNKDIRQQAINYLNLTDFTSLQQQALDKAYIAMINASSQDATLKGTIGGKTQPWLEYAVKRNLVSEIEVALADMPTWFTNKQIEAISENISGQEAVLGEATANRLRDIMRKKQLLGQSMPMDEFRKLYELALGASGRKNVADKQKQFRENQSENLAILINSHLEKQDIKGGAYRAYNYGMEIRTDLPGKVDPATEQMQQMFADSNKEYTMANGRKLKDYFTTGGKLKVKRMYDGRLVPDASPETTETQVTGASRLRRGTNQDATENTTESLTAQVEAADQKTDDSGKFRRADGKPVKPLGRGEIELIVKKVLNKLKVKPTVTIVANVQELAQSNPELYRRAAAGRPLKDFDTVEAAGYSIGDQVIIFSDYIKSKEQARLVVAHEALGHFGFRAFMPRSRMDAILREVYRTDKHVKAAADTIMRSRPGIDMMEAVEEVLADKAAAFDNSLIYRIRSLVQAVLDTIGMGDLINIGDADITRYFLRQSRRNLMRGGKGVVGVKQIAENIRALESEAEQGRFSMENVSSGHATNWTHAYALNKKAGAFGSFDKLQEYLKNLPKGRGRATSRLFARVAETVQTLDNKAQRSEGLQKIFNIFQRSAGKTRRVMSEYERMTSYTHTPNWFGLAGGPTARELQIGGEMLAFGAVFKANEHTPASIQQEEALLNRQGDAPVIDTERRSALEAMGKVSKEQFKQGILYQLPNKDRQTKSFTVDEKGEAITDKEFDNAYRIYEENRNAVNQAAIDVLEANILSATGQKDAALNNIENIAGQNGLPTDENIQTFNRIIEEYTRIVRENTDLEGNINNESFEKGKRFIAAINRALWVPKKLDDWAGRSIDKETGQPTFDDTAEFQTDEFSDIIASLPDLANINYGKEKAFQITGTIQNLFVHNQQIVNAEFQAKRTMMTGYVPFTRRGKYQVRMQAYNVKNGAAVKLQEDFAGSLPYFQTAREQDAMDIMNDLNKNFVQDKDGKPIKYQMKDSDGNDVVVAIRPQVSEARQSQPLANTLNLTEFMSIVSRLDIGLTIEERQRVVTSLAGVSERARKSLQRTGNPGWDQDVVRSVAEHLETMGHVAGKVTFTWQLNDILDNDNFFKGDPDKLKRLEAATRKGSEEQREAAKREYEQYAYAYSHSADINAQEQAKTREGLEKTERGETLTNKDFIPNEGRGESYRLEANKLIKFYSDSASIVDSTEDQLSGDVGSRLKLAAVLLQLGGSFATAGINLMSMVTHTIPYLGTYNKNRGYGGGFGLSNSTGAMVRAVSDIKRGGLANYDTIYKIANDPDELAKYNIEQDEANAMLEATGAGVLQAAQFNALVGTSRGGRASNNYNGAIKAWMSMFSYTEQLNRRATFLASYRLERERILATDYPNQGGFAQLPEAEQEVVQQRAMAFATKAVNTSQGEYAMYNRPEMARGNLAQYIFMYKQFVIVSVQLMKGLSPKGRIAMLGTLFVLAGLSGLPFADDLSDLIETLAQKFGIKMGTVEQEAGKLIDALIPGASPIFMRGILDPVLGATFSTRLGFNDLIPLTGVFQAKNNSGEYWQEAKNFLGPVYSGIAGLFATGTQLARYGAETIGLKDDTTEFRSILRDAPSSAIRGIFDGLSYMEDGRITKADGTVLTKDVGGWTVFWRMLGFYPYSVSIQNDIIRASRQNQAYLKSMKAHYIQAYVKAKLDNDRGEMRRILKFVDEHNKDVGRDSEFYFRNFTQSANKSFKAARRTATARFRKTAPKQSRDAIDEMAEIWGIELDN